MNIWLVSCRFQYLISLLQVGKMWNLDFSVPVYHFTLTLCSIVTASGFTMIICKYLTLTNGVNGVMWVFHEPTANQNKWPNYMIESCEGSTGSCSCGLFFLKLIQHYSTLMLLLYTSARAMNCILLVWQVYTHTQPHSSTTRCVMTFTSFCECDTDLIFSLQALTWAMDWNIHDSILHTPQQQSG